MIAEISLIQWEFPIVDGIEQPAITNRAAVFADVISVNRAEFYSAPQAGYRADIIFEMWAFEYYEQQGVEHSGKLYKVIRAYKTSADRLQLTCQRMEGLWR